MDTVATALVAAGNDVMSVSLDGVQLFSAPFSEFKRGLLPGASLTEVKYTYHPINRVKTVVNETTSSSAIISSYTYTYDKNGNRTSQTEVQDGTTETTSYSYDAIDRLTNFLITSKTVSTKT